MATASISPSDITSKNFYQEGSGIWSWLSTTDHKRIGIMYLFSVIFFFIFGMAMAAIMQAERMFPGEQLYSPDFYNQVLTLHGVAMVFLVIIPSIPASFGNFFLPLQIGAEDVMFPRLNLASWYILMIGFLIVGVSLWNGADTGWTFYAPYSVQSKTNVALAVLGAFVIGFSSILTGLNFIVTIHRMRAPGMTWFKMPLFTWALYATSWIQVLATPVVGITLVMVILDRMLGANLFNPATGGDPIMFQHLFWIYSHPAVYIMILPGMGVVSEIIPCFARKNIFGYKFIAFSSIGIAAVGSLVWGHHMFTSGMSDEARYIFSFLTYFVAIPSAIKVFNWVATMYKGSIHMNPSLMFVLVFIFLFLIGGFTGLVNAAVGPDIHIHDTLYVVAHFHYVMFGSGLIIFFAAMHYWHPKIFGKMYNEKMAYFWSFVIFIGFNATYMPMFVMGMRGAPRRYHDFHEKFSLEHLMSSLGAYLLIFGLLAMLWNLYGPVLKEWILGIKNPNEDAPDNPWNGTTLEWQTATPPPLLNFDKIPTVTHGPYYRDDVIHEDLDELSEDEQSSLMAEHEDLVPEEKKKHFEEEHKND